MEKELNSKSPPEMVEAFRQLEVALTNENPKYFMPFTAQFIVDGNTVTITHPVQGIFRRVEFVIDGHSATLEFSPDHCTVRNIQYVFYWLKDYIARAIRNKQPKGISGSEG